ncbi:oxidoreductase [Cryomorphaceae bacterium 1068]|nr:oxidoreductase [Cryomorphaceae bacterium 1068]
MKAVIAGATGLIGTFLVDRMKTDKDVMTVTALTRRDGEQVGKVAWTKVDFDNLDDLKNACDGASHAFCCLGTTINTAGSKEAFRKVDHDYVIDFAKAAKSQGIERFSVVSAIGSSADSSVFYNKVKGEMERDLENIGFASLHVFHPSLLLGPRKEDRLGEKIGTVGMKLVSPLMMGSLTKYKPIHVKTVAGAMLRLAKSPEKGVQHYEYDEMTEAY